MFDVIIVAPKKSHLLLQTVNSVIGSTDLPLNLIVSLEEERTAVARNKALKCATSRYVFFVNPDVFVHPGTFENLIELLKSDVDLVTVKSLLHGEEEDGLFGIDTHTMAPSVLSFDEIYVGTKYATLDFFEQFRWTKHRIAMGEKEVSHAPAKEEANMDKSYFETKWRSIRMGETKWLNPSRNY